MAISRYSMPVYSAMRNAADPMTGGMMLPPVEAADLDRARDRGR
jgi:hypothetical protein